MAAILVLVADPAKAPLTDALLRRLAAEVKGEARWLGADCAAEIATGLEPADARTRAEAVLADAPVDLAVLPPGPRLKRLLISDMDSTMITIECIDELADHVGIKAEVAAITRRAMNGDIDFRAALTERVALLEGVDLAAIDEIIRDRLHLMPGAERLVPTMRAMGARAVLVSGGFTPFTAHVRKVLGFDVDEANELEAKDGRLTGRLVPPLRDASSKVEALQRHCRELGIGPADALAVGDGANDVPMLLAVGTGVAFHAHPRVRAQARVAIDHGDLTALLYLQGIPESEHRRG